MTNWFTALTRRKEGEENAPFPMTETTLTCYPKENSVQSFCCSSWAVCQTADVHCQRPQCCAMKVHLQSTASIWYPSAFIGKRSFSRTCRVSFMSEDLKLLSETANWNLTKANTWFSRLTSGCWKLKVRPERLLQMKAFTQSVSQFTRETFPNSSRSLKLHHYGKGTPVCCLLIISRKMTIRKSFLIAPLPGNMGSLAHLRVGTLDFPEMNFLFEQISTPARSLQSKWTVSHILLTKDWIHTTPHSYD